MKDIIIIWILNELFHILMLVTAKKKKNGLQAPILNANSAEMRFILNFS